MEEPEEQIYHHGVSELPSAPLVLLSLMGFVVVGSGLGLAAFTAIQQLAGWEFNALQGGLRADSPASERWPMRVLLLMSQLGTFVFAGWATTWLFYRKGSLLGGSAAKGWASYLRANRAPVFVTVLCGVLIMLAGAPFVLWLYELNKGLPLPDDLRGMEANTAEVIKGLLQMETPAEFWFNLLLIGAAPALGEEWVFRGILQQQLMRLIRNPWVALLLSAAVFSFIHLQFEGFLPRMWLGLVLGWLYWKTQHFWVPVVAHFANNAVQVIGQYLYRKQISSINLENELHIPLYVASLSLAAVLWLAYKIIQMLDQPSPDPQAGQAHAD